jgi:hypothetical protein
MPTHQAAARVRAALHELALLTPPSSPASSQLEDEAAVAVVEEWVQTGTDPAMARLGLALRPLRPQTQEGAGGAGPKRAPAHSPPPPSSSASCSASPPPSHTPPPPSGSFKAVLAGYEHMRARGGRALTEAGLRLALLGSGSGSLPAASHPPPGGGRHGQRRHTEEEAAAAAAAPAGHGAAAAAAAAAATVTPKELLASLLVLPRLLVASQRQRREGQPLEAHRLLHRTQALHRLRWWSNTTTYTTRFANNAGNASGASGADANASLA